jgi:hypothetical protein
MRKRAVFFFIATLFSLAVSRPAHALTVPVEAPPASPETIGLQAFLSDLVSGVEAIVASIGSAVGHLADGVSNPTPSVPSTRPATAYSAAASVTSPPVADDSPPAPASAPDPTPMPVVHTPTFKPKTAVNL